jgi:hypothetical protein
LENKARKCSPTTIALRKDSQSKTQTVDFGRYVHSRSEVMRHPRNAVTVTMG